MRTNYEKDIGGCGIIGIMDESGKSFSGESVIRAIANMHERGNGLGGGFAGYGIYPEYSDCYAFHIMYEGSGTRELTEGYLQENYQIEYYEPIPTRKVSRIGNPPDIWRYFVRFRDEKIRGLSASDEANLSVEIFMRINSYIDGAFACSSGKNMGIFKGVGYPEDIAEFFKLDDYKGYTWTGHARFPTNSPGWWGGAHPFGLLDWSVVHNGEISSYGINRSYLENFGYKCTLSTDTEVITYLFDLLARKHGLNFELVAKILSAPFWSEIDRLPENERRMAEFLRITYGSALVNGPFSVIVADSTHMMGLNDRIKLRPLVAARDGDFLYIASEEAAIREVCPLPEKVWSPNGGEPVIGKLKEEVSTLERKFAFSGIHN